MSFDKAIASKVVGHALVKMFSKENVMAAIGMEHDDKGDDFWRAQTYSVVARFYDYVLYQMGLALTLDRDDLTPEQFGLVMYGINTALRDGVTYQVVRDWWLCEGQLLHNAAFTAKHEAERLATLRMRVLVFFDQARPRFLAKKDGEFTLTTDEQEALNFPICGQTQMSKDWKERMSAEFGYLLSKFPGATSVKVI